MLDKENDVTLISRFNHDTVNADNSGLWLLWSTRAGQQSPPSFDIDGPSEWGVCCWYPVDRHGEMGEWLDDSVHAQWYLTVSSIPLDYFGKIRIRRDKSAESYEFDLTLVPMVSVTE